MEPQANSDEYLAPLDVIDVHNALDWSWLIDVGQGNFTLAKEVAQEALQKNRSADTLFARGLVHQLQGEYNLALELYVESFAIATDATQRALVANNAYLTECQKEFILPDGFALIESDRSLELDSLICSQWCERSQDLKSALANTASDLASNTIDSIIARLPQAKTIISADLDRQEIIYWQKYLTEKISVAQNLQEDKLALAFYAILAELLGLAGASQEAIDICDRLEQSYKQVDNFLGAGWCLLTKGDLFFSQSFFGKPILFGYRLSVPNSCYRTNQQRELLSVVSLDVQEFYLEAREYFVMADARRGEGMAILRLAYLETLEGKWHLATLGYEEAREAFISVGDCLNAIAAEMGKIWTCAYNEDWQENFLDRVSQLILILKENGAIAWIYSWAASFIYAALDALATEEDLEIPRRITKIAQVILNILESLSPHHTINLTSHLKDGIEKLYSGLIVAYGKEQNIARNFEFGEQFRLHTLRSKLTDLSTARHWFDSFPTLNDVINYLPLDSLLLSYILLENRLFVWAIGPVGTISYRDWQQLGDRDFCDRDFIVLLNKWDKQIIESNPNPKLGKVICDLLIAPFSEQINNAQRLIILPFGRLHLFPFNTLPWQGKPLGWQKTITYINTANRLLNLRHSDPLAQKIIIVLNNEEDRPLLRGISELLGKLYQTKPLSKQLATKTKLSTIFAGYPRLIHFFDPVILNTNNPLNSGIILGEETISVKEWAQIKSLADLVILSNCDATDIQLTGEEIVFLTQSILQAGAKAVIISLWQKNDLVNGLFAYLFYQQLQKNQFLDRALVITQQQLSQVTIAWALEFCAQIQSQIPWEDPIDRAHRAILTKYMGDLMALGGDYTKATEAYRVAINIFTQIEIDYPINFLHQKYQQYLSLSSINDTFNPQELLFNSFEFWSSFKIVGDWR
jgi:CHAT domain-containing protein